MVFNGISSVGLGYHTNAALSSTFVTHSLLGGEKCFEMFCRFGHVH